MLEGEAKTAYMRDYMRRKRLGLPTVNPKPEWKPNQRIIDEIAYWARHPLRTRGMGWRVIDGLTLDNDASWMEACRRYKAIIDERRAARKARKQEPPPPPVRCCMFCGKPKTARRILIGNGFTFICQQCATKAVRKAQQAKKQHGKS